MFVKAFLSHSSKDKNIVHEVAVLLSRANCIYDVFSFETGEDFSVSIERGLQSSQIFVLFVGKDTLERPYVQQEITLAERLYKQNKLKKSIVFIIDNDVDLSRLPEWLKSIKYEKNDDPHHITRVIKKMLDDLNKPTSHFIGRDHDAEKFEEQFSDYDKEKNIYFITGIVGIGRKTFTRKMLRDKLSIQLSCCVDVKSGDGALEMALNAMDSLGEKADYRYIFNTLKDESIENRINFLIKKLEEFLERGECIIFCDKGGIFHSDGTIDEEMKKILSAISACPNLPVFFNTTMRPPLNFKFRQQHLRPLSQFSSKLLLNRLLPKIEFDDADKEKIISRAAGYPPAIIYAAELVTQYGSQANFLDKIKDKTYNILSNYVSSLNIVDSEEIKLLALLCRYTPLSFSFIEKYLGKSSEQAFKIVEKLINSSILEVNEFNFYEISKPLEYAISKLVESYIHEVDHSAVKDILSELTEKEQSFKGKLLFMRQLTRAKMFLKEKYNNTDMFYFISDVQNMAETAYNEGDYKKAIEYSEAVINEREKMIEAYEILIKSFIREDEFTEAKNWIGKYKRFAQPKSIHFLEGFLKRYQNDFEEAIKSYKKALENGYTSASIYRELAQCFILIDHNKEALQYAEKAYERQENNIYIMDIYANALARNKMLADAKKIIDRMMSVSQSDFVFQRAAIFELSYGNPENALNLINKAIETCRFLTFDMIAQKVSIACACNDVKTARETYEYMKRTFPRKRIEMQQALLMHIYFIEGDRDGSMMIHDKLKDCELVFVKRIMHIIESKL